uniref:39S ribosomal protein L51, mitochondrial n=1 Tax=Panagrellus redivivus TaxID=6233 RepID=A0A7E4ZUK2_PANRE
MLFAKVSGALKPFGLTAQAVRYNCPWHRNNYRPAYFPFNLKDKLRFRTVDSYKSRPGGKELLMRRLLREQEFLGWQYDHQPKTKKLSYPL